MALKLHSSVGAAGLANKRASPLSKEGPMNVRVCASLLFTLSQLIFASKGDAEPVPSRIRERTNTRSFRFEGPAGVTRAFGSSFSEIGPDARVLRYEYAGRMVGSAGGEIIPFVLSTPVGRFGLLVGGLLEVSNFSASAGVPYQMLRANIGLGLRFEPATESRAWSLGLAFDHESDHFSGESTNLHELYDEGNEEYYDGLSSYEFLRVHVTHQLRLGSRFRLRNTIAARIFTPPFAGGDRPRQNLSISGESFLEFLWTPETILYIAGFYEWTFQEETEFGTFDLPSTAQFGRAEFGFRFAARAIFDAYFGVTYGDGRGVDFIHRYPPGFTMGIRAIL